MSRTLGHPAPVALASLRAGLAGGRRRRRLSAHVARCPRCARVCTQLDAVTPTLREAPCPSLPMAVEGRIVAALTTEAARRQAGRPDGSRRTRRSPSLPVMVASAAAAGALVVGARLGYLLSSIRTGPVSPAPIAGPPASGMAGPTLPAIRPGGDSSEAESSRVTTGRITIDPASGVARTTAFMVTDSNTAYQKATLRTQVRHALATQATAPATPRVQPGATLTVGAASPGDGSTSLAPDSPGRGSSSGTITAKVAPSRALVGCVLHLTGDVAPKLVDLATYQSEQVYVIAVPDEAWVVGIGCTAARPALITSVGLNSAG